MRRRVIRSLSLAASLASPLAAGAPALAQSGPRATAPAGAEIAARAKSARLDRASASTDEFEGKRITFTPALAEPAAHLADGQLLGVLENDVAGDETGLPPGRYNLFIAQLADGWHVYAESGGQIVKEALRVQVKPVAGRAAEKRPRFRAKGWGYDMDYGGGSTVPMPVASVAITPSSLTALMGEKKQFTISLRDVDGNLLSGRSVLWTSSAPAIATASAGGVVTGVAPGTATLTATSGGKSATATVSVAAPKYVIYPYYLSGYLYVGANMVVDAMVSASNCVACPSIDRNAIQWSSSNPSVATITPLLNGTGRARLTNVAEGVTTVAATYAGVSASGPVTISRAPVGTVTVSPAPLAVIVGQVGQLTGTVRDPAGTVLTDRAVTWTSQNPAVASVTTAGRVLGLAVGSTTITATSEGVSSASVPVIVNPVPVATVTVAPDAVSLSPNTWTQLQATLRDAAGNVVTGRTVTWTTDNPAIADVTASGMVLGVASGSTIITATSEGKTGTAQAAVPGPSSGPSTTSARPLEEVSFSF